MYSKIVVAIIGVICCWLQQGICQTQRLTLGVNFAHARHYYRVWYPPHPDQWESSGRYGHIDITSNFMPVRWMHLSASAPLEFIYNPPRKYRDIRPATARFGPRINIKTISVVPYVCGAVLGGFDLNRPYFEYARGYGAQVEWHFSRSATFTLRFDYLQYRELRVTSGSYHDRREKNSAIGLQFNLWKIPEEPTKFDRWLTEKRSKLRKQPD